MTEEKQNLYNELKRLSKQANQRILRLERLTGEKETFATKDLIDLLSSEPLQAISKTGRIRVLSSYTDTQMVAIIKAMKDFLNDKLSTVSGVKKEKKKAEDVIGKPIKYGQISTFYTARELYKWANKTFGSDFWKEFAPKVQTMNQTDWVEFCELYIGETKDTHIRRRLVLLYNYLKG